MGIGSWIVSILLFIVGAYWLATEIGGNSLLSMAGIIFILPLLIKLFFFFKN